MNKLPLFAVAFLTLNLLIPSATSRMCGFNFNGYAAGPQSFTVPRGATFGRIMDVSYRGADVAGAPWWGHMHLGPGQFNFTKLDLIIDTMLQENNNICLLFPIWGTPTWLASDPKSCSPHNSNACFDSVFQSFPGSNTLPTSIEHWKEFITALVTRYSVEKKVIYAYEIWNEPTNLMFLNNTHFSKKDWEFLGEMQYEAYSIIKQLTKNLTETPCLLSTDPTMIGNYVLAPSLIYDGNKHMASLAEDVLQGINDYKKKKNYNYLPMDSMTCHVYNNLHYDPNDINNAQIAVGVWSSYLDQCCAALEKAGMPHPSQPWLTELGYTVDQPYPPYEGTFAYSLVQMTYEQAWSRGNRNIKNLFWYSWNLDKGGVDFNDDNGTPSAGFQAAIDHCL